MAWRPHRRHTPRRPTRPRIRREQTPSESFLASFRRVRELTGIRIPIDTMRGWVTKAQIDAGERPGASSSEREEIRRLKR